MDKRHEVYALTDRHFHETPDRISAGEAPVHEAARRAVPDGWNAARIGDRLTLTPPGRTAAVVDRARALPAAAVRTHRRALLLRAAEVALRRDPECCVTRLAVLVSWRGTSAASALVDLQRVPRCSGPGPPSGAKNCHQGARGVRTGRPCTVARFHWRA
ncbi:hypothetical protein [Streptomyces canus]|uniref:hypothetical protein n=1 Tax=Streptomyces canus TaxID=58343 RepID=UPI0027D847F8|nr:hypothetical protein [Streptomyces canus]